MRSYTISIPLNESYTLANAGRSTTFTLTGGTTLSMSCTSANTDGYVRLGSRHRRMIALPKLRLTF